MTKHEDTRRNDDDRAKAHLERQVAFRGEATTVCANEATNTPELCGSEMPVIDAEGRPLHPESSSPDPEHVWENAHRKATK